MLLAEDNAVNCEVAVAMLKGLGCGVEVAQNGREAVAAASRSVFDLVLMDCQMPEMDGFEATRALREAEKAAGRARVPIVALTANAMEGDRERCLAAGMDDYLAKPFRREQMRAFLSRWVAREPVVAVVEASAPAMPPPVDSKALDNIRALQRPGAPSLLERIVALYFADAPRLIAVMRDAVSAGDAKALQYASHQLKSSSANLGAGTLAELCKALEAGARAGRLTDAERSVAALEREFARVRAALTQVSEMGSGPKNEPVAEIRT